jgi:hypothetical protein
MNDADRPAAPAWLAELASRLRRDVDAAPEGFIRFDLHGLADLWECSPEDAEAILSAAALYAELAIGSVDGLFCDVMTPEEAEAVLAEANSVPPGKYLS